MTEKIYVIGDDHSTDITFSTMREFPEVSTKTYQDLFSSKTTIASEAPILLCFPYSPWDAIVETGDLPYGMEDFGQRIRQLAEMITETLEQRFPNAQYVNPPMGILIERDKLETKRRAHEQGISIAPDLDHSVDAVMEEIEKGGAVYIKPRFGSMGKGITYVSPKKWTTNFKYENGIISNHSDDKSWREIDITGDSSFLERILEEDVVVEKAVRNPQTNGIKFDLRIHSIFGQVDPALTYGRVTDKASITNVSQGAKSTPFAEMCGLVPENKLIQAQDTIRKVALALGFNYAGGDILFEGKDYLPVFNEINSFPSPDTLPSPEHTALLMKTLCEKIVESGGVVPNERPYYQPPQQVLRTTG